MKQDKIKFHGKVLTLRGVVKRLLNHYTAITASSENRRKYSIAQYWYMNAHQFCNELAANSGVKLFRVVGIVAALSPLKEWSQNKQVTKDFILKGSRKVHTRVQVDKAEQCLEADTPEDVFRLLTKDGLKTSQFFWNIYFPLEVGGVTIDRHALGAALSPSSKADTLSDADVRMCPSQYRFFSRAYAKAAEKVGLKPHSFQAMIWEYWKDKIAENTPTKQEQKEEAPF